jgi:hypothetical protein
LLLTPLAHVAIHISHKGDVSDGLFLAICITK